MSVHLFLLPSLVIRIDILIISPGSVDYASRTVIYLFKFHKSCKGLH